MNGLPQLLVCGTHDALWKGIINNHLGIIKKKMNKKHSKFNGIYAEMDSTDSRCNLLSWFQSVSTQKFFF